MIKILSLADYGDAMEIMNLKEKAGGMHKPTNIKLNGIFLKYFADSTDQCIALGYFEEGKLISWVSLRFIYSITNRFINTWNITGMFSSKFDNMFSFNRPEIGLLIKTAFEIAEHRHCWKYYYTISTSHQFLYDKLWKKNNYLPTGRYTTEIERIICPNDSHLKKYYEDIVGTRRYDDEFVIKRRILNPEFRIKYDSLHELELQATHKEYHDYTQFNFDYARHLLYKKKVLNIVELSTKVIQEDLEVIVTEEPPTEVNLVQEDTTEIIIVPATDFFIEKTEEVWIDPKWDTRIIPPLDISNDDEIVIDDTKIVNTL